MAKDQKQMRWERAEKVARDVIDEARVQLMLKFRFLDLALWRMDSEALTASGRYALATDGNKVYFEPYALAARFEESFGEFVRDYLHLVMHCIFRHPFAEKRKYREAWWLSCDIVVESACIDMCSSRFASGLDAERRAALSEIRLMCPNLTPNALYALFERSLSAPEGAYRTVPQSKMNEYAALFERDDHGAWPAWAQGEAAEEPGDIQELSTPDENADEDAPDSMDKQAIVDGETPDDAKNQQELQNPDAAGESRDGEDDQAQGTSSDADDVSDDAQDADDGVESGWQGSSSPDSDEDDEVNDEKSQDERDWEEIAEKIEMDLDTFSREWGDEAGSLIACLAAANRKRYDYGDFLRRFCSPSEEMKVNDDEFDYVFYTYGLSLYGNMPLVEPLEYKETQCIRDFVICIDTSESCKGETVRAFVERTFDIMKRSEDYAHAVNVHVIQCDAKVQADTKVTDLRDVDRFMEGFFIRGMGGTDFRPAFSYVETLRDRGELPDMKGMIYFTDGLGAFPDKAPDYECAFVMLDTGEPHMPSVPPWAMRVVVDEEGINSLKSEM